MRYVVVPELTRELEKIDEHCAPSERLHRMPTTPRNKPMPPNTGTEAPRQNKTRKIASAEHQESLADESQSKIQHNITATQPHKHWRNISRELQGGFKKNTT
jgi:hypothetical protein